jgi:hypothetical protein
LRTPPNPQIEKLKTKEAWAVYGFATKHTLTQWVYSSRLTIILPYKLDSTNDLLTSRAGLLVMAHGMESLKLDERIDPHFPQPNSNRGFQPSEFIKALELMQHEGRFH